MVFFIQHSRIIQVLIQQATSIEDERQGILVEDCQRVSRQVGLALEVAEPPVISGRYHLEVSSPGVERPLLAHGHFVAAQDQKIALRLHSALPELSGSKKCKAKLLAVEAEHIQLQLDNATCLQVKFSQIDKARVAYDWNAKTKDNNKKIKTIKKPTVKNSM